MESTGQKPPANLAANIFQEAVLLHKIRQGKISVVSKMAVKNEEDLSLVYTPGVAEPCKLISKNRELVYDYTDKGNLVAIVSDGSAVLGLGRLGPEAALPVMEGKAVLFKIFAGIDAFPICLKTGDPDKIVETVKMLEPTFGGINLEDIAAPACFAIERRLKEETEIPVFHDDQHGTAVVVAAGLINALQLAEKEMDSAKVVINGAGAAAIASARLLLRMGVKNITLCDSKGVIYRGRPEGMNEAKEEIALLTNPENIKGGLSDALPGADVFIGLSRGRQLTKEMVKSMAKKPVVFALANPEPEIYPAEAKEAGAFVVATGRSDYPNQINNVLAFPGIFRGALDVRAKSITGEMKLAAARAIAGLVPADGLSPEGIIPHPFNIHVSPAVAGAVAEAAISSGAARRPLDPQEVVLKTYQTILTEQGKFYH
jgi:malate dehydrogenase (oxaloacetate-decarboxylating)